MSEFRVDRPGRYRDRSGAIWRYVLDDGNDYWPICMSREGNPATLSFARTGEVAKDGRGEHQYDLIAYLGPLEEEMVCSTVNDPTSFATDIGIVPADPAISDAAWKAYGGSDANHRDICERFYARRAIVWRTREEWEQHVAYTHRAQEHAIDCGSKAIDLSAGLAAARAEIDRLNLEIAALEKSRNHCEFCDAVIAVKAIAPAHPRIPLTTPQIDRYTMPMLGAQK